MDILERFLKYVRIDTSCNPNSGTSPSFDGEWELAKMLAADLNELGLEEVSVSDKCYVMAKLSATAGYESCKKLGFIAHMDTSDAASGKNVNPKIWENYDGENLVLSEGIELSVEKFSALKKLVGHTLITTDGTTLLGADNKAGIAEIFSLIETIKQNNIPHGPLRFGFTPDEEIGEGADFFELLTFDADFAYTVDGGDAGELEYQNFNAAQASVTIHGLSVHPGYAKNTMLNAQNVAFELHALLPQSERPEHTESTEGFFHLCNIAGDVTTVKMSYIIRDHSEKRFEQRKTLLKAAVDYLNTKYSESTVELNITDSYYNMEKQILPHMHLVDNARIAIEQLGIVPIIVPVRGGTDGAALSYKGLPCPNLGTGGFNAHGIYEFASLEKMKQCRDILVNIVKIYASHKA